MKRQTERAVLNKQEKEMYEKDKNIPRIIKVWRNKLWQLKRQR